jgi:hypothetical protein
MYASLTPTLREFDKTFIGFYKFASEERGRINLGVSYEVSSLRECDGS